MVRNERFVKGPSGRAVLAASAALMLYMAFVFPGFGKLRLTPALGDPVFDLRFLAPPDDSLALAATLDPEERRASIISHWTFDLAYPALYGAFMFLAWRWSLRKLGAGAAHARLFSCLTLVAPLLDLAENACIAWLLAAIAAPASATGKTSAALLSVATPAKWVAVSLAFAGTLLLSVIAAIRIFRTKSSTD